MTAERTGTKTDDRKEGDQPEETDRERKRREQLEESNRLLVEQEYEPNYIGSPPLEGVEIDPVTGKPDADDDNPLAPNKGDRPRTTQDESSVKPS